METHHWYASNMVCIAFHWVCITNPSFNSVVRRYVVAEPSEMDILAQEDGNVGSYVNNTYANNTYVNNIQKGEYKYCQIEAACKACDY